MKSEIIEAEFKVVAERTLDVIATEIRTIDNHVCQVALSGAVEIGQKLTEAKEKIGHGNWKNWCEENLKYSKSQAERFMKIATEYGEENSPYLLAISKTYTCTDFSISKAFRLLQVPEEDVENFAEKHDIEDMTVKDLEAEIKKLKEEKEKLAEDYSEVNADAETRERLLKEAEEKLQIAEQEKTATYELLQELQEKALEANNKEDEPSPETLELQKEIDKLKAEAEKAKKKQENLKAEADKLREEKAAEIEAVKKQALEEATEVAVKRAEEQMGKQLEEQSVKAEQALARAREAEKELQIAGSETLLKRKANMDLIGVLAKEIKDVIDKVRKEDPQQAEELSQKTKLYISSIANSF